MSIDGLGGNRINLDTVHKDVHVEMWFFNYGFDVSDYSEEGEGNMTDTLDAFDEEFIQWLPHTARRELSSLCTQYCSIESILIFETWAITG